MLYGDTSLDELTVILDGSSLALIIFPCVGRPEMPRNITDVLPSNVLPEY